MPQKVEVIAPPDGSSQSPALVCAASGREEKQRPARGNISRATRVVRNPVVFSYNRSSISSPVSNPSWTRASARS